MKKKMKLTLFGAVTGIAVTSLILGSTIAFKNSKNNDEKFENIDVKTVTLDGDINKNKNNTPKILNDHNYTKILSMKTPYFKQDKNSQSMVSNLINELKLSNENIKNISDDFLLDNQILTHEVKSYYSIKNDVTNLRPYTITNLFDQYGFKKLFKKYQSIKAFDTLRSLDTTNLKDISRELRTVLNFFYNINKEYLMDHLTDLQWKLKKDFNDLLIDKKPNNLIFEIKEKINDINRLNETKKHENDLINITINNIDQVINKLENDMNDMGDSINDLLTKIETIQAVETDKLKALKNEIQIKYWKQRMFLNRINLWININSFIHHIENDFRFNDELLNKMQENKEIADILSKYLIAKFTTFKNIWSKIVAELKSSDQVINNELLSLGDKYLSNLASSFTNKNNVKDLNNSYKNETIKFLTEIEDTIIAMNSIFDINFDKLSKRFLNEKRNITLNLQKKEELLNHINKAKLDNEVLDDQINIWETNIKETTKINNDFKLKNPKNKPQISVNQNSLDNLKSQLNKLKEQKQTNDNIIDSYSRELNDVENRMYDIYIPENEKEINSLIVKFDQLNYTIGLLVNSYKRKSNIDNWPKLINIIDKSSMSLSSFSDAENKILNQINKHKVNISRWYIENENIVNDYNTYVKVFKDANLSEQNFAIKLLKAANKNIDHIINSNHKNLHELKNENIKLTESLSKLEHNSYEYDDALETIKQNEKEISAIESELLILKKRKSEYDFYNQITKSLLEKMLDISNESSRSFETYNTTV
ncbi:hypothetical protein H9M94_00880 [Mycoplasma sp. Pen4]|uniref:hypothetical protein n=1 Tax=Mycoplasma sp. Pen4 TaxID=640330 RepID=UPI0016546DA0|nr:hypothetical protein [Mycoplasma sp. Pen4]QNM93814.1 hypothetical protein H9M94_00880 [Mycoplasma sp. Pen4]